METFSEFDQQGTAPQRNFSDILSHGFNNYFKVIWWAILLCLIFIIISSVISAIATSVIGYDQAEMQEVMKDAIESKDFGSLPAKMFEVRGYSASNAISYIVSLLLYPVFVGFLYILQKGNLQKTVNFSDLFIGFRQNTLQIILFGLLSGIAMGISMMLCFFPVFFVAPLFALGLPIVFFENTTAVEGIKKSINIATKNYGTLLGVSLVSFIIAIAGVFFCGIGLLASFPFMFAAMYSAYCAFCGTPRQIN